jgi:hypothetical protein
LRVSQGSFDKLANCLWSRRLRIGLRRYPSGKVITQRRMQSQHDAFASPSPMASGTASLFLLII